MHGASFRDCSRACRIAIGSALFLLILSGCGSAEKGDVSSRVAEATSVLQKLTSAIEHHDTDKVATLLSRQTASSTREVLLSLSESEISSMVAALRAAKVATVTGTDVEFRVHYDTNGNELDDIVSVILSGEDPGVLF